MTLSFVVAGLGLTNQALRQSALASNGVQGLRHWQFQSQRAFVMQTCGRFREALDLYSDVIPRLHEEGARDWMASAYCNRGILHALCGRLTEAESDLVAARTVYIRMGRSLDAAVVLWNLGCLARDKGDVVSALERFDAADPICTKHGEATGTRLMDRAALLLSVGVHNEARVLAQGARDEFDRMGQVAELVESEILLAQISMAERDHHDAIKHARIARTLAHRQHRHTWALRAKHLELLASGSSPQQARGAVRQAERVANDLEAAHWIEAATEARLAAAQLALARGMTARAIRIMSGVRSKLGPRSAPTLLVRKWHVEALIREQRGDAAGAARAVRTGLGALARHRASLGASDLQAHVPVLGEDLAQLGMRLAIKTGKAHIVLREVERWRGQELRSRPVRPPRDPELSVAVEKLRRASADLQQVAIGDVMADRLRSVVATCEREVLRLSRRTPAAGWGPASLPPSAGELRSALADRVLVEFMAIDRHLMAVVLPGEHGPSRSPSFHRLGPLSEAAEVLEFLQFALLRMATGRGSDAALRSAMSGAVEASTRLDALLLLPLRKYLGDAPLVIAPTEALHAVPWSVLPLTARVPIHVVRSGTAWLAATEHDRRSPKSDFSAFISGPGVCPAPRPDVVNDSAWVSGPAATVARALQMMGDSDVTHIAAHGSFREENPLLSSLRLSNGDLTVYDVESLAEPPRRVVLASCHSASSKVLPGNQLLGFTHALLTQGSAGVVATTLPTPDVETERLMSALHENLDGQSSMADALFRSRNVLDLSSSTGYATSAGFDVYGR